MKKHFVISLVIISVLGLGLLAQVSLLTNSYYGYHDFGDCAVCHNEPATAYNMDYMDENIELDGIANEPFWQEPATEDSTMYIPVAHQFGGDRMMIRTVFAQNSSHIFMKMDWTDYLLNGTDSNVYDGISIYWSMGEATEIDEHFPNGMKTVAGEADVWNWKAGAGVEDIDIANLDTNMENVTVPNAADMDASMNTFGIGVDGEQNLMAGATYGYQGDHHENSYLLELAFPLESGYDTDVQFTESGYYTFNLALFNSSSGSGHQMGFEHDVWVYNGPMEPNTVTLTQNNTITEVSTQVESEGKSPVNFAFIILGFSVLAITTVAVRRKY